MQLTDKRRAIEDFLQHMDRHVTLQREAEEALHRAEAAADRLIEAFRGESIPEVIVYKGRVVEINRALLATEHAQPHHAVRVVHDVLKVD